MGVEVCIVEFGLFCKRDRDVEIYECTSGSCETLSDAALLGDDDWTSVAGPQRVPSDSWHAREASSLSLDAIVVLQPGDALGFRIKAVEFCVRVDVGNVIDESMEVIPVCYMHQSFRSVTRNP